ncbi:MAG: hypothetical protein ABIT71_12405 [Vicinamibacteraceae bacterium]
MRHTFHVGAACCIVTFIGSTALSAQAPPSTPQRPVVDEAGGTLMKAFSRLFAGAGPDEGTLRPKAPTPSLAPLQICGIKVLHPDPTIDPKFEVPLRDTTTRFAIRTVPVLCR